jgi:GAF domain-containing protein
MDNELVRSTVVDAEKMAREGIGLRHILSYLVLAAEKHADNGSVSSILLLDTEGLLRNGASPGVPNDYISAIDGIRPHPNVGTCASAAATGAMVVTKDFFEDGKWAELRHLPLALGFHSAWSVPIKTSDGKVLGTFGTYSKEKRIPEEREISTVNYFANAVARILSAGNKPDVPAFPV